MGVYGGGCRKLRPLPLIVVLVALPAVVILGVLLALIQRIREIQRGEEDDAKNY